MWIFSWELATVVDSCVGRSVLRLLLLLLLVVATGTELGRFRWSDGSAVAIRPADTATVVPDPVVAKEDDAVIQDGLCLVMEVMKWDPSTTND